MNFLGCFCYLAVWRGVTDATLFDLGGEWSNTLGGALFLGVTVATAALSDGGVNEPMLGLQATTSFTFFLSGLVYWYSWFASTRLYPQAGRGLDVRDVYLWANTANVIAALLYAINAVGALIQASSAPDGGSEGGSNDDGVSRFVFAAPESWGSLGVAADFIYLFSSIFYIMAWKRDLSEEEEPDAEAAGESASKEAAGDEVVLASQSVAPVVHARHNLAQVVHARHQVSRILPRPQL